MEGAYGALVGMLRTYKLPVKPLNIDEVSPISRGITSYFVFLATCSLPIYVWRVDGSQDIVSTPSLTYLFR
jgi:hypothetical protein